MYDRTYQGKALNFEASGGLTNASLVMQDKQTDTYWSLMKGQALSGELEGEKLRELPVGEKVTWKVWRARHPNTKVLSVNSQEDGRNPYQNYFADSTGFRGLKAKDDRLKTKTPIFAFHHAGKPFAVAFDSIDSGATFKLPDGNHVFLYRTANDELFRSTAAFISNEPFVRTDQGWSSANGTDMFDGISRTFNDSTITPLNGFDTFWYNWSLNNPGTELLTK